MSQYKYSIDFGTRSGTYENITHIVNTFGIPKNIIEIGVYEGMSTFWMADNITPHNKDLKIYAIDPHNISTDIKDSISDAKQKFLYNLNECDNKNVEYINKTSYEGLLDLINRDVQAEFIYIDGDHRAKTVLLDLVLSYQLLVKGGVILCDDSVEWQYKDDRKYMSAQESPRMAIESFIMAHWNDIRPLCMPNSYQTAFIKL